MGQLVGAGVELGMGQLLLLIDEGDGIGSTCYLFSEADVGRVPGRRRLPGRSARPATVGAPVRWARAPRAAATGPLPNALEDLQVSEHPLDRLAVEKIRAVLQDRA